jgi:hypothetical protein
MGLIQQSYDRICKLKVFQTLSLPTGPTGKSLSQIDPIGLTFPSKLADGTPAYRIKFNVNKTTGPVPVPHPAVIEIYNLGETSRKFFKFNNHVILQAGYGTNAQTIFEGNISYVVTKKSGPDYVTEVHAADGLFAHQNSLINLSLSQSTTAAQVLTTLTGALTSAGVKPGLVTAVPTAIYNKGIVLSGKVIDELKSFCDSNDLNWTIENNALNVVKYGEALLKPIIFLSPDTGLVGIPEQRAVDTESASLISLKHLLNPQIGLFQLILVKSKFVNGGYITAKVIHTGDTFGLDWYTELEAT